MSRKPKYTDKQKREFARRLSVLKKSIDSNWLNKLLIDSPTLSVNRAINVYKGTTIDFDLLQKLESLI